MRCCKIIAVIPLIMLLLACANTKGIKKVDPLYNHVVKMDRDGTPLDIEKPAVRLEDSEFEERVASMVEEIKEKERKAMCDRPVGGRPQVASMVEKIKERKDKDEDEDKIKTVMIYVHGAPLFGNVRNSKLHKQYKMSKAACMPWYPIFFTWNGSLFDVYYDHLYRIRWGYSRPKWGIISSPIYLAADFLRLLSAAPKTWLVQLNHIWRTEFPQWDLIGAKKKAEERHNSMIDHRRNDASGTETVDITTTKTHDPKMSLVTMAYFQRDALRYLPQAFLAPPISSFGKSVWKNYQRRVDATIWRTSDFGANSKNSRLNYDATGLNYDATGTFAMLINKLNEGLNRGTEKKFHFVLIGHSTGTNILSKLISQFPELDYRHIVFLGATATLEDFRAVIIPYMKKNKKTKFFNISLDGYAEARSTNWGITPYGSLLEWIDNFIAEPSSPMHRVMGKWNNMILAEHIIPEKVRGRVTLKQLSYGKDGVPQKHRELDNTDMVFNLFDCKDWQANKGDKDKCRSEYD